jgi:hypothetical protein
MLFNRISSMKLELQVLNHNTVHCIHSLTFCLQFITKFSELLGFWILSIVRNSKNYILNNDSG